MKTALIHVKWYFVVPLIGLLVLLPSKFILKADPEPDHVAGFPDAARTFSDAHVNHLNQIIDKQDQLISELRSENDSLHKQLDALLAKQPKAVKASTAQ